MVIAYLLEHNRYMNLIGIVTMLAIAVLFSYNRRFIHWSFIAKAFVLQILVGLFILKVSFGTSLFIFLAKGVQGMYQYALVGTTFLFGNLVDATGPWGVIFAVKVLPVLIFFSAFINILFHLGIIQRIVKLLYICIHPLLKASGIEILSVIATSMLGQTEALFFVRNYIASMTKGELFVLMTVGMSTISASLIAVFSTMGIPTTYLLSSVCMSIFGSLMMAKIIFPTVDDVQADRLEESRLFTMQSSATNVLEACAKGTADGLQLALMVGAMLISFLACIALLNDLLTSATCLINYLASLAHQSWKLPCLTLDVIFSYLLFPIGYLLGLEGDQAFMAGQLLGKKIAVNEFIAFSALVSMSGLSERATTLMTYALCGFSNFSCIGIQLASIGVLAPEKRPWIAELGLYAVLAGVLSNLTTAMIAGLLI